MSYLYDVRNRGLPYGGINDLELLKKIEETDMEKEDDEYQIDYNNYIKGEIIDWTQDKPFLESDKTRRDTSLGKSILNLRYVGTRGELDRPNHSEMFINFMDSDPRSLDNNPRFDQYKQQINTRESILKVNMGHNDDNHISERPRSNQSLIKARQQLQHGLANNTKVFTHQMDGRAPNQNFLQEYDHNKPQLIYKDILPYSMDIPVSNKKSVIHPEQNISHLSQNQMNFVDNKTNINLPYTVYPDQNNINRYTQEDHNILSYYNGLTNNVNKFYAPVNNGALDLVQHDQTYKTEYVDNNKYNNILLNFNNDIPNLVQHDHLHGLEYVDNSNHNNTLLNYNNNISNFVQHDQPHRSEYIDNSRYNNINVNLHNSKVLDQDIYLLINDITNIFNQGINYHIKPDIKNDVNMIKTDNTIPITFLNEQRKNIYNFKSNIDYSNVNNDIHNVNPYMFIEDTTKHPNLIYDYHKQQMSDVYISQKDLNSVMMKKNNTNFNTENININVDANIPIQYIQSENSTNKHHSIVDGNNNNIIINSEFNIPEYSFKHIENNKHASIQSGLYKNNLNTEYKDNLPNTLEFEPEIKTNSYVFSDDIYNKLTNVTIDHYIKDIANTNPIFHTKTMVQSYDVAQIRNDTILPNSTETYINKSQKQIRTGANDDPSVIDMLPVNDFENIKQSGHRGNKSIRSDYLSQDNNILSENINDK